MAGRPRSDNTCRRVLTATATLDLQDRSHGAEHLLRSASSAGAPDEALRPLDLAPRASGPARGIFAAGVVDAELERLASLQQPDGGWTVDFESASPAAALEWRGYATVAAIKTLQT